MPKTKEFSRQPAVVFYAPLKGRRYFSKRSAVHAEAEALLVRKYPTEKPEGDYDAGFHWREMPGADAKHKRLIRFIAWKVRNV